MNCLVTGASGFIGSHLVEGLRAAGHKVNTGVRRLQAEQDVLLELSDKDSLTAACQNADVVFHCAGYAHAHSAASEREAHLHRSLNFEATVNMAEAAAASGVKTFVFFSSVKAMGEPGRVLIDEDWPVPPRSEYGVAKRAAEDALWGVVSRSSMQAVVLRPAMVYGPRSRGNLERLLAAIARRRFPPMPQTNNHRSMIHVSDVVSAAMQCAFDTRAQNRTYILAHTEAPSGRDIYEAACDALNLPAGRWALSETAWRTAGWAGSALQLALRRPLPLNREVVARLLDSAWYSPRRIEQELGWRATVGLREGLKRLVHYKAAGEIASVREAV